MAVIHVLSYFQLGQYSSENLQVWLFICIVITPNYFLFLWFKILQILCDAGTLHSLLEEENKPFIA